MKLHSYLIFNGNCADAFSFYEKTLGGKIEATIRYSDMPKSDTHAEGCEGMERVDPNGIAHICLRVGDYLLMGSDGMPSTKEKIGGFNVNIEIADVAEAESTFKKMSEGGTITMPIQETFWAKRFAMFTDKFGTPWMINCPKQPT